MTIIALLKATVAAYVFMAGYSMLWSFKRPVFMPFWLFKFICSLGKKCPIYNEHGALLVGKIYFEDIGFNKWYIEVVSSGSMTLLQMLCFHQQRLTEIDDELRKRGVDPNDL